MVEGESGPGDASRAMYTRLLMFTGSNSRGGQRALSREDYLRNMRKVFGLVSFTQVTELLGHLNRDGLVKLEFLGPDNFKVWITPLGMELLKRIERGETPDEVLTDTKADVTTSSVEGETPPHEEGAPAPLGPGEQSEAGGAPSEVSEPAGETEPDGTLSDDVSEGSGEETTSGGKNGSTEDGEEGTEGTSSREMTPEPEGGEEEDEEAGPPVNQEPITDLITSMQAHVARAKGQASSRPPDRKEAPVREPEEVVTPREQPDFRQARENLEKRERAIRDRTKSLAQREAELIQREEAFEETRSLLEKEIAKSRQDSERLTADIRARLPGIETAERQITERERALALRLAALEEREDTIMAYSVTLNEHEDAAETLDEKRIDLRDNIRDAHDKLVEHLKKSRRTKP